MLRGTTRRHAWAYESRNISRNQFASCHRSVAPFDSGTCATWISGKAPPSPKSSTTRGTQPARLPCTSIVDLSKYSKKAACSGDYSAAELKLSGNIKFMFNEELAHAYKRLFPLISWDRLESYVSMAALCSPLTRKSSFQKNGVKRCCFKKFHAPGQEAPSLPNWRPVAS